MAKVKEKQEALKLRRKGVSIKEIAIRLEVSKGSVSLWCQDVVLSKSQKKCLKLKQISAGAVGRQIGAEVNKQKRLSAIRLHKKNGVSAIRQLSNRDLLILGLGLYWGEGIKSRSGMAAIVNSDPEVISVAKVWFERCFDVKKEDFRPYVYISAHHSVRKKKIVLFWSEKLNLPADVFKIILLKNRPKKIYPNHETYHGVLHLRARRSTDLKYRILGLIDACKLGG